MQRRGILFVLKYFYDLSLNIFYRDNTINANPAMLICAIVAILNRINTKVCTVKKIKQEAHRLFSCSPSRYYSIGALTHVFSFPPFHRLQTD
jgi:hypothetical protein